MTFPLMVGEAKEILMPPPLALLDPMPFVIVNPLSSEFVPSLELNVTTEPAALPLIVVTEGPPELVTVMAFPMKLMFS